jgi:hypothetical protein
MKVEERKHWHARLDELLDLRERLEQARTEGAQELGGSVDQEDILDAIEYVAAFINALFGNLIELDPRGFETPADYVETVLQPWHVAFGNGEVAKLFWLNILSELIRFEFGDEPVWLRPRPRRRGENARPGKLALARMSALAWNVLLERKGLEPKQYRAALQSAYGPNWDAMRKWKESLLWEVDKGTVDWAIHHMALTYEQSLEDWELPFAIYFGGMNFRLLTGTRIRPFAEYQKTVRELGLDGLPRVENLGA